MNHLDLFSGIGGFSLAARNVRGKDHNIVAFVEQDKYCQKILNKHWPNVPIFNDIRSFNGKEYNGTIDLLTGGFPCQPFSVAGKRKGKEDDRYLWPEMFRIIQEAKPTWIIGENVPGIINMGLETTVLDLEAEGYEVEILVLPACGVGAWHQRYRVWIVCHSKHIGLNAAEVGKGVTQGSDSNSSGQKQASESERSNIKYALVADPDKQHDNNGRFGTSKIPQLEEAGILKGEQWPTESGICRVANGIPNRVDRLKGLGNAIVPQVVMPIMEAIKEQGQLF